MKQEILERLATLLPAPRAMLLAARLVAPLTALPAASKRADDTPPGKT